MTVRIIDIETTGVDPATCGVCEIASADLTRDKQLANLQTFLANPGYPMPPEASAVHHLIDADLAGEPPLGDLIEKFSGADVYVAHNAGFEQSFLNEQLGHPRWICTFKASLRVWPEWPSHSNQYLRYRLGLAVPFGSFERDALQAHRALADVIVTGAILVELMEAASWGNLLNWSLEPALYTVLSFGKHKGTRYDAAPADYLDWIANKSDLDADTKFSARHWLNLRSEAA